DDGPDQVREQSQRRPRQVSYSARADTGAGSRRRSQSAGGQPDLVADLLVRRPIRRQGSPRFAHAGKGSNPGPLASRAGFDRAPAEDGWQSFRMGDLYGLLRRQDLYVYQLGAQQ